MAPIESELLHNLGSSYLTMVSILSIAVFFYGASSLLVVSGYLMNFILGVLLVLFAASVVIFMFVFFCTQSRVFLSKA